MVRKVVIPATISVRALVLFSLSLNSCSSIRCLPRRLFPVGCRSVRASTCANPAGIGLGLPLQRLFPTVRRHANEPIFPAHHEGEPFGGADRLAPPDAARGPGPPDQRRHLCVAAA